MSGMPEDVERERRIEDEVVVDAYGEDERALGWYYYLGSHLRFPFIATCTEHRIASPLQVGGRGGGDGDGRRSRVRA